MDWIAEIGNNNLIEYDNEYLITPLGKICIFYTEINNVFYIYIGNTLIGVKYTLAQSKIFVKTYLKEKTDELIEFLKQNKP